MIIKRIEEATMKFLSFSYNDKELYGVKVKREESAWDLIKVL